MNRKKLRMIVQWMAAIAIAAVFIFAAIPKINDPADFAQDIKNYKMLPLVLINAMAIAMPWLEMVAAIAILVPRLRRSAALLILGMSCMFMVAVSTAMIRGLDISCGCFGEHSTQAGLPTLLVDISMLICALILLWRQKGKGAEEIDVPDEMTPQTIPEEAS